MSFASSTRGLFRLLPIAFAVLAMGAGMQDRPTRGHRWAATWTASVQGPYPSGNASAQPVLDFAFESPARGAIDQTFRLVLKPDLWGSRIRLRFANTFGTQPVTLDDVFVGLQSSGGNVAYGTNEHVMFGGRRTVTLPAGRSVYSDPVTLRFVNRSGPALLHGRRLAVSFHVPGPTGPMTWHAKALTTSYVSAPGAGSRGADETDSAFPYTTTSWYFLDAVDVLAADDIVVVACFGDSITDGTGSTLNGDDRWPDVLARRLHGAYGARISVVNAGIGGNQVAGPATYNPAEPFAGGPSGLERLDRDVLGIAGLTTVVWLEGINDLGRRQRRGGDCRPEGRHPPPPRARRRTRDRRDDHLERRRHDRIGHGQRRHSASGDQRVYPHRRRLRRDRGFRRRHARPAIGWAACRLPAEQHDWRRGGSPHPNRAGYQAMAHAVDLRLFAPRPGK